MFADRDARVADAEQHSSGIAHITGGESIVCRGTFIDIKDDSVRRCALRKCASDSALLCSSVQEFSAQVDYVASLRGKLALVWGQEGANGKLSSDNTDKSCSSTMVGTCLPSCETREMLQTCETRDTLQTYEELPEIGFETRGTLQTYEKLPEVSYDTLPRMNGDTSRGQTCDKLPEVGCETHGTLQTYEQFYEQLRESTFDTLPSMYGASSCVQTYEKLPDVSCETRGTLQTYEKLTEVTLHTLPSIYSATSCVEHFETLPEIGAASCETLPVLSNVAHAGWTREPPPIFTPFCRAPPPGTSSIEGLRGIFVPDLMPVLSQAFSGSLLPVGGRMKTGGQLQQVGFRNSGSVGHPELCQRPCLYATSGNCVNGDSCEFCHLEHLRRPPHMDKRQRRILQDMALVDLGALLLPPLHRKVLSVENSPQVAAHIGALARLFGVDLEVCVAAENVRAFTHHQRTLQTTLKGMSLRLLVVTIQHSAGEHRPEIMDAIEDLLAYLKLST